MTSNILSDLRISLCLCNIITVFSFPFSLKSNRRHLLLINVHLSMNKKITVILTRQPQYTHTHTVPKDHVTGSEQLVMSLSCCSEKSYFRSVVFLLPWQWKGQNCLDGPELKWGDQHQPGFVSVEQLISSFTVLVHFLLLFGCTWYYLIFCKTEVYCLTVQEPEKSLWGRQHW